MKQKKWVVLGSVVLAALMFAPAASWAGPRFSLLGGVDLAKLNVSASGVTVTSPDSKLGFGGGAEIEFPLGARVGLEIGALYLAKKFDDGGGVTSTANYIQVPVILRYWFAPVFSIGVGGYAASGIGSISDSNGGSSSFSDNSLKTQDYGLVGSAGFNIPLGSSVGLLIDGRYCYGLYNISSDASLATLGGTAKYTDVQGFIGLRFGGMRK